jgi:hypothetical protein
MMISGIPCLSCAHVYDGEEDDRGRLVCEAFPDGIPDDIYLGKNPHTEPFPGDGGIMFTPETDAPLPQRQRPNLTVVPESM